MKTILKKQIFALVLLSVPCIALATALEKSVKNIVSKNSLDDLKKDLKPKVMIDKVLAILYHAGGPTLILQSHLRPDLSDSVPTLKEVIVKELVLQRAKQLKIPLSEADKERHLARAQEQLGMTREGIEDFFKERGLTLEEAKEELGKILLIEMTVDHVVRSKAYVSSSEIEAYHKKHPMVYYEIKQSFIPYTSGSRALHKIMIDRDIESGESLTKYTWGNSVTIKAEDIAPEKEHIKQLKPGTVIFSQETSEGISLLQLVSKNEIPLS
ncbi:hypothetical protein H0X06_03040, partial [Candidatus Dependentiae bacterium]|nr:hypothetical protein [Candidatus Dependentiae bacterium]